MSKQVKKLILPFAVAAKDRLKPFTKDMEIAAIFYLAESDREKGEGRILKKPAEKLAFIAETCYPLWIIPWKGRILLFDGLNLTKHTIDFDLVPDAKAFNTDVQASSKSREAYCASLSQNANYFQKFAAKQEKTIDGLVKDPKFNQDFMDYLQEVEEIRKLGTTKTFLSPVLEKSDVSAFIGELSDLRTKVEEEIKSLSKSMKLLSKLTKEQAKAIQKEMKETIKKFNNEMDRVRPEVMEKINKIQEKRDKEVTQISRNYYRKLRSLHKNRIKIEKTIERLSTQIERCEADIKVLRDRDDKMGELQLCKKLEETEKKIPTLQKELQSVDKEIENVEDAKKIEIARARAKPEEQTEEAMKALRDIEAAKEARTRMQQQELADLEEMTTSIINQINEIVKTKEAALNEIDNIGTSGKRRKYALVYTPFYFVSYESISRKRYVVYPPSILSSMGIKTRLKGVFGANKMKSFLQPYSQVIAALLDKFVDLTQENPVFREEITEAGIETNILKTTESRVSIMKGLKELMEEDWISKDEFQYLNKLL